MACLIKAIEVEPLLRGRLLECVIICRANSESVAHWILLVYCTKA